MKWQFKIIVGIAAILSVCIPGTAGAGTSNFDSITLAPNAADDTYGVRVNNSSGTRVFSVDSSGNTYIAGTVTNSNERKISFGLGSFIVVNSGTPPTVVAPLSATSAPYVGIAAGMPAIAWADGVTSPISVTFRIPSDYSSGGAFRLICTESNSTTPNQVDFDVFVNTSGTAYDSAVTDQTPVALTQATTTPSVVTLTPATDFSSLSAGKWVTIRIWRDDVANGTGILYVHGVDFYYTASR